MILDAAATSDLVLLAPVTGWAAPLAEVPDPVFAEKMMGDGVAIDPIGALLCAPCDGPQHAPQACSQVLSSPWTHAPPASGPHP